MAFAPQNTCFFPHGDGSIRGRFVECEFGHMFEFSAGTEDDAANMGERYKDFNMRVWVGHGQFRMARVIKTRAFVIVDEDENGFVVEKWMTKRTEFYTDHNA